MASWWEGAWWALHGGWVQRSGQWVEKECEQYQELTLVGTAAAWPLLLAWRSCFTFPLLSCRALLDSLASRVPMERRAAG